MMRSELNELAAFAMVARERSFTRAAAKLGVSQSALSHTIRGLEQRLELRLLARTTKSVAPTAAGAALLKDLSPALEQIAAALDGARSLRRRPAGRLRIVMSRSAAVMVLLPRLAAFAQAYPDIVLDVVTTTGPVDLVAGEFDAGIQLGEYIQKDMIAVRVTPELRLAVVGSPGYFSSRRIPQKPRDLKDHQCIALRLPGGPSRWEFERARKSVTINASGSLIIDDTHLVIQAALAGVGLGLAYEEQVAEYIAERRLVRVLEEWTPPIAGFFLYYPSRQLQPAALSALVNALRLSQQ
ncbi:MULTISPECIES: LysR family transcriptional regulator [unclassified Mesorhizobium]|uniref:LysR substrate-binding domain-containing protein n=1 Tax=unclassified Mesorhizobium TaxID=325217 RepID=UPI00112B418F|nr:MULTISPECIES: LysR family transcriptional regulator [unclassified Mesorhizobium]MBZ9696627.1 LysR family transcriptional regulator [Mesorhizobium sp. CO1-1-9]MBZ9977006.1 LysR family transcriptional regulator [Mesorhizobium sp. BR-1-1-10]TPK09354.1 LysR family transcriptional regulator [Mesorhizobium sp. B2-5-7]TPK76570.1 LysR family transcriptional regulator [Mesorhizobium sp. B2-4-18]TPL96800.1 LysR family transcriptional regulator [Mesorhizobium sp. B2-3-10]